MKVIEEDLKANYDENWITNIDKNINKKLKERQVQINKDEHIIMKTKIMISRELEPVSDSNTDTGKNIQSHALSRSIMATDTETNEKEKWNVATVNKSDVDENVSL